MKMYSDVHRVILQACANNGCLEMENALQILSKAYEKNDESIIEKNRSEMLVKFLDEINVKIQNMDQRLIVMKHEILNKEFLVFIHTMEDPINEFHLQYNVAERAYFRLLLRQITEQNDHCLRIIVAINSISNIKEKTLSKKQAENLLENWKSIGYFLIDNDLLMFGARTIAEYGDVLKSQFPNDVKTCLQCKNVLFYGVKCGNDCETIFHRDCIKERLRRLSYCPSCKDPWDNKL